MFGSARDAKAAGWFSRRHQSMESHQEAVDKHAAGRPARPKQVYDRMSMTWRKK